MAKLEADRKAAEKADKAAKKDEKKAEEPEITEIGIEDFLKVRLICAQILECEPVPKSDKLLKIIADDGEGKRQIVSGIAASYKPEDLSGIFVNIKYQNQLLTLTTGVSYRLFSTDKDLDFQWDELVKKFLKKQEVPFEEL